MESPNQKVAIVTGSSTGIGYETSLALARDGFITYATMRNLSKAENIKSVATNEELLQFHCQFLQQRRSSSQV
jgi:NAD(P)-dependent dehydrogenase (short-subunit alcohol dehydrogenase family)